MKTIKGLEIIGIERGEKIISGLKGGGEGFRISDTDDS